MLWEDGSLDLEHGVANIHRAYDRRKRTETSTKTESTRASTSSARSSPLLETMRDEADSVGPVMLMPSERDMSRGWLRRRASQGPSFTRGPR